MSGEIVVKVDDDSTSGSSKEDVNFEPQVDACYWCGFDPVGANPPMTKKEWEDWVGGVCPSCKTYQLVSDTTKHLATKGKWKSHDKALSEDDTDHAKAVTKYSAAAEKSGVYWDQDKGMWKNATHPHTAIGGTQPTTYQPTTVYHAQCNHKGDKLDLGGGVVLYGYSHTYNSKSMGKTSDGKEVDLFVAMHTGWMQDLDVLVTPGVKGLVPSPLKPALIWVNTPDYNIPFSPRTFLAAARYAVEQSKKGLVVACGCMGGHGRTGMFMATCAMVAGAAKGPSEAYKLIKKQYCSHVSEAKIQQKMLKAMWELLLEPSKPDWKAFDKRVEKYLKEKQTTAYTVWPSATKASIPLPKRIKIRPEVVDMNGVPKDIVAAAGQEFDVREWSTPGGGGEGIRVLFETSNTIQTVFRHEYEIVVPGDPPPAEVKKEAPKSDSSILGAIGAAFGEGWES